MRDFANLQIWHKAHNFTLGIYKITDKFPKQELFGIVSQLRRCASSIAANIAEGCCRNGDKEFAQFLQVAMGSASESKYFLILSKDLGYIDEESFNSFTNQIDEILKMISVFINKLRN